MKIYYQKSNLKEVWGNYMCRIRFLNSSGEIIYSRNVFYHNMKYSNKDLLFMYWISKENILILYEYLRPNVAELVLINFENNKVYRRSLFTDFSFTNFFALIDSEKVDYITNSNLAETFILEKIEIPIFHCWSKLILIT
jgi:hypothetical protein